MSVIATCCVWSSIRPTRKECFRGRRKSRAEEVDSALPRQFRRPEKELRDRDRKRVGRRMWLAAVCFEKRGCGVGWVRTSAVLQVDLRSYGSVTASFHNPCS